MTKLVLIRHGATEWNKEGRYCGRRDIGLSKEGKVQAEKLCRRFEAVKFDKIYCSDRKRAIQTGRILFKGVKIAKVKGLREINFGMLEGLCHKEIMKKHRHIYEKWLKNPYENNIPKAEPMTRFRRRIGRALERIICLNPGRRVAVVCHGGVIGIFLSGILNANNLWRHIPSAASITMVECGKGKSRIKKFNDTAHLR